MFLIFLRLLPVFSFWLLASLLHLKFSLFLVQPIETLWGVIKLKNYAPQVGYLFLFFTGLFLIWYFFVQNFFIPCGHKKYAFNKAKFSILLLWVFWFLGLILINHYLLATALENIHFAQYAFLGLLFIWALKPLILSKPILIAKTLFWVSLAGIIDESMQYTWITASYSKHLDFNDFLLNLMGAIAGVLVYFTYHINAVQMRNSIKFNFNNHYWQVLNSLRSSPEVLVTLLFSCIIMVLSYFDYIQFSTTIAINEGGFGLINSHSSLFFERLPNLLGSWENAFNRGKYYILSPLQGLLVFLIVTFGFYWGIIASLRLNKTEYAD